MVCICNEQSSFLIRRLLQICAYCRCREPVKKALDDAKLSLKDLQEVVLVGGSTRIPGVQNLVKQMTGKSPNVTVNPDEVVALGAAVQVFFLNNPLLDSGGYVYWTY